MVRHRRHRYESGINRSRFALQLPSADDHACRTATRYCSEATSKCGLSQDKEGSTVLDIGRPACVSSWQCYMRLMPACQL